MEKPESLAPVSGLSTESPGGVPRAVPGGVRGIQTDTGLPSGVGSFRGPGSLLHSGNSVRSPGPTQPSEGAVTLNSGPGPYLREVASLGSSTSPATGTGATKASTPGPEEPKVYSSESSTHSGSSFTERPRSILKNSSSILIKKPSNSEKKSQRWDEMNILATYHPADKDYGFMKADEPRTPYHRLQDNDEDPSAESSLKVTPESVAERFATMDNFLPKVLQYGDNKNSKTTDNFTKTHSTDFDKHRKIHYSEGKYLKTPKNLPSATEEENTGAGASIGSSNQDSATYKNQFPSASDSTVGELATLQRKEYYSKGRYLRSCSHPELGEDIEDEEQDISGSQVSSNCWAKGRRCRSPGSSEKEHGSNQNPPCWNGRRREPGPRQGSNSHCSGRQLAEMKIAAPVDSGKRT
ncbi:protein phosphatase inhibitor 2-like isoform X4 [Rattus norvegicus]|uniref:protein phosphatase inhibitor 2-like isoform 4 n=1 Tax=Rattus norvegicus TaxID=10116 RepID=UPI002FD872B4